MTKNMNSLIKEAFLAYEYRYAEGMEKQAADDVSPSEEFRARMRVLISNPEAATKIRNPGKRTIALLIAAAVLISLLTACACIHKIRGFIVEFYEDHIRISKHDDNSDQSNIET